MAAENYLYEGIIVTTYGVIDSPTEENPNRVTFNFESPGDDDNVAANFIHQIKDIGGGLLEGTKLTVEGVREVAMNGEAKGKLLFSIYGFAADPRGYMIQISYAQRDFKKFMLIPVIWPSKGKIMAYFADQRLSASAGELFQSITPTGQNETISKSILCHSMGNRVLRNFANEGVTFDNIFMVAADVDANLFNARWLGCLLVHSNKKEQALNIKNMLTKGKGGKIHVLYSKKDEALSLSAGAFLPDLLGFAGAFLRGNPDPRPRLGREGVDLNNVIPEVKDFIASKDVTNEDGGEGNHKYQFKPHAIDHYESMII